MRRENRMRSVFSADVFASCLTLVCFMTCSISLTFDRKLETAGYLIHEKKNLKSVDFECFELV